MTEPSFRECDESASIADAANPSRFAEPHPTCVPKAGSQAA